MNLLSADFISQNTLRGVKEEIQEHTEYAKGHILHDENAHNMINSLEKFKVYEPILFMK